MNLSKDERQVLIQIVSMGRYTPHEWEQTVKPIFLKLQEGENGDTV